MHLWSDIVEDAEEQWSNRWHTSNDENDPRFCVGPDDERREEIYNSGQLECQGPYKGRHTGNVIGVAERSELRCADSRADTSTGRD